MYVYGSFSPRLNIGLYNHILFHPMKELSEPDRLLTIRGVKGEEVFFESKDAVGRPVKLNGWLYEKPHAPYIVLLSHGNAGNVSHRVHKADALLASGCSVFLYDYQGYGKSEGAPDGPKIVADANNAYEFLLKRNWKPEQVILYGESLGTGVTSELSKTRSAKAVILESGFISPEVFAKERIGLMHIYPPFLFPEPRLNNMELVTGQHPPLLIMFGAKDKTIPPSCSERLANAATQKKSCAMLPNNGHNDIGIEDKEAYVKALKQFIDMLNKDE